MKDRLHSLAIFRRVARCGSFSRAARELGLSQPSVSRTVSEIERSLGVTLLVRTTRAVALTEAGADYLARVEAILDAFDEAEHAVRGASALKGSLRLGVSSSFGLREVVPRLAQFLTLHPGLSVDLVVSDRHDNLITEGIDIAFRLGALADSTVRARRLGEVPRILVASPIYLKNKPPVLEPQDLEAHSLIVGPGVTPPALDFRRGEEAVRIRARGRVSCGSNEGATALARAGLGITASSLWCLAHELESKALVRVLSDWTLPPVELHAVFPPGRAPSPAARAFADYFAAAIAAPSVPP